MLQEARRILVINLRYIGDAVWTSLFLRNLQMNLPDAEISAVVNEGSEVFLNLMPGLSEIIVFERRAMKGRWGVLKFLRFLKEIRKRNFDTVFILSNSDRPYVIGLATGARSRIGFKADKRWRELLLTKRVRWDREKNPHIIEGYLQVLTDTGLKVYDRMLALEVPEAAIRGIAERFGVSKTDGRKTIIVHPGARHEIRQWPAERFAEVINSFAEDCRIFLVGGPDEGDIVRDVLRRLKKEPDIVSNDLSLLEFAALCKFGGLFVGNDSAPIHIAAATGLFVVGIYGPTFAGYCGPWTDRKALFDISELPCRMCDLRICTHREEKACLKEVTSSMVIGKIRDVMRQGV